MLLALALAACSSPAPSPHPQPQPPTTVLPSPAPVAAAETQEQAIEATKATDLPLLRTADRVKITYPRASATAERTGADVTAIVDALEVKAQSPSAGVTYAQLAFYRGETLLREIWMYDYGEWGIVRPGTARTLGTSKTLAALLKK